MPSSKACRITVDTITMESLILASQSPRRRQLLSHFGIDFEVVAPAIDETPQPDESPTRLVTRLAEQKACAVFRQCGPGHRVLGGDTIVVIDRQILGKPVDRAAAISMLSALSGRTHRVHSAVAVADRSGCRSLLSTTQIDFYPLSAQQIEDYCASSEPYDKAGGYAIQGRGGQFVRALDGSFSAVMGLPLWATHRLLIERNPAASPPPGVT